MCVIDILFFGVDKFGVKVVIGVGFVFGVVVEVVVFVKKIFVKKVVKVEVLVVEVGVDDLKKFFGVGLVFEKKLYVVGVIFFV